MTKGSVGALLRWRSPHPFEVGGSEDSGRAMAAVAENAVASPAAGGVEEDQKAEELQRDVRKLVDLLSKLNPSAKEFFPSSYPAGGRRSPPGDGGDVGAAVENKEAAGGYGNYYNRRVISGLFFLKLLYAIC